MLFRPLLSPNWNAANSRTAKRQSEATRNILVGRALGGIACMFPLACAFLRVAARIADAPDGIRSVIGYEERSIGSNGDADWASPDVAVVHHEPGDEIFVLATGAAGLVHGHTDHFVTGADGAVPRAVFGGEDIAAILGRKLRAFIEGHFERSVVGLEEDIRNDHLVFQFGVLALVAWILMGADVPPRPAVEAAVLNVGDVVGDEIVSQAVAFVDGAPKLVGLGIDGQAASGVADSVGIDAHFGAVGIELQNVGAVFFCGCCIRVIDVRGRAYGDEHFLAVSGTLYVSGPVSAAVGKIGDVLGRTGGLKVPIFVRNADDGVCVSDVDPLGIVSRRVKGDAVRLVEAFHKDGGLPGFAIGCDATEDLDFAAAAFSQEKIAVGGGADQAR